MPATFGFAAASVEAHRCAGEGFRRCERATAEIRTLDDERNERMQLRAALWQVNDMLLRRLCRLLTSYSACRNYSSVEVDLALVSDPCPKSSTSIKSWRSHHTHFTAANICPTT
jgi:hypothetical protein